MVARRLSGASAAVEVALSLGAWVVEAEARYYFAWAVEGARRYLAWAVEAESTCWAWEEVVGWSLWAVEAVDSELLQKEAVEWAAKQKGAEAELQFVKKGVEVEARLELEARREQLAEVEAVWGQLKSWAVKEGARKA